MLHECAKGWPRGRSWLILAIALAGVLPASSRAQDTPPDTTPGEKAAQAVAPPAPSNEPPRALKAEPELWAEPNRQALLQNSFQEISRPIVTSSEAARILQMAQGRAGVDQAILNKYIEYYAGELTKHAYIDSLLNPQADDKGAKAMEAATNQLVRPLLEPETSNNAVFRKAYIEKLAKIAPVMLKGHLHTRTFFMVVLSRARSPLVVPTLVDVLKDPDQPATVKLLAAVGITSATHE
ncbi:MAG TPA: hypothetical protein VFT74_05610, partial [Isosphaeraceae bacterium]|nr:hypothetical protein [Isosphaeraceae bacterium]